MSQLLLTSDIVRKISDLSVLEQSDVMRYVNKYSHKSQYDTYRKNAIREIRRALLSKSSDF